MALRTRLVSLAAIGALGASTLALAPAPAQATPAPSGTTVGYSCTGTGGLSDVTVPLVLTLQDLTDVLTAGTPLQPVIHSGLGEVGNVLTGLFDVLDQILAGILAPIQQLLQQIFGTVDPTSQITSTISNLTLQLVDQLGSTVSSFGAQLTSSMPLNQISEDNPLELVLGQLTGGLTAPAAGDYDVTLPGHLDLSILGSTTANLDCVVTSVGGAVVHLANPQTDRVVVGQVKAKPNAKVANPCTVKAAKVGTKKTSLKLAVAPKKVKSTRHGRLGIKATYKLRKNGKARRAHGTVRVCDGTTYLGSTTLKKGKRVVLLPKLSPGKHLIVVRYAGAGKAKPTTKRILVRVKR